MDVEEIKAFVSILIFTVAALYYCYSAVSAVRTGKSRLLALIPVLILLAVLPLKLNSFILGGPTSGFLTLICNFKLLLFAFGKGPLSEPFPNFFRFFIIACLPVLPQSRDNRPTRCARSRDDSAVLTLPGSVVFAIKVLLLALMFKAYEYRPPGHPNLAVSALYAVQTYLTAEAVYAIFASLARFLLGSELEPHFDEPYLATSLQDFWGRRWNLIITSLLRPMTYDPIQGQLAPVTGRKLASLAAVLVTFAISGLIHELIFYYITRAPPTWEVTWFFILQGVCVGIEVAAKTALSDLGKPWRLQRAISGLLTVAFVVVTAAWLFFPQLTRNGVDEKAMNEIYGLLSLGKQIFSTMTSKIKMHHRL